MCIEISNNTANASLLLGSSSQKKVSYSIRRMLKQLFKQTKRSKKENTSESQAAEFVETLEFLENLRNSDVESECASLESHENEANERRSCEMEDYDFADISAASSVPVHFVRTENGIFFWTALPDVPVDCDLVEPLYCCTSNQIAVPQIRDRWAQA